ncbi:ribokinase [Propionivibrio soli]|uniref:ribokinase n=1 Tax=Propionivibrio soli TaxID=2976531 RepID=UPI0021E98363|nr:ribokinase [Propionivibrio soli]
MNKVVVVGSINMDLVVQTGKFPAPGETVLGSDFKTFPGGKGANQAVAASRLGAKVTMVGCVGDDAFGTGLLAQLQGEGVETRFVRTVAQTSTGIAAITVSRTENSIVVVPGANYALTADDVLSAEAAFAECDVVLSQLEVPLPAVEAAAALAERLGKPFVLNPAPAMPLPDSLLDRISLLTPNEHELAVVLDGTAGSWRETLATRPERVLMTKGIDGAWFVDAAGTLRHQPAFRVLAVDTTGAGDTFNGALAAFWGKDLADLARLGCAASALSVTRPGAQGGMPTQAQLTEFLRVN